MPTDLEIFVRGLPKARSGIRAWVWQKVESLEFSCFWGICFIALPPEGLRRTRSVGASVQAARVFFTDVFGTPRSSDISLKR